MNENTDDPQAELPPSYPSSPGALARIALYLVTHQPAAFTLQALRQVWQVCQLEQLPSYYRPDPRHWPDCLPSFLLEEQVAVPGSYIAAHRPYPSGRAAWPGWFPAVLFLDLQRTQQLADLATTSQFNRAPLLWMDHTTDPATSHFVAAAPPPPPTATTDSAPSTTDSGEHARGVADTRQWTEQVTTVYELLRASNWNEYIVAANPHCPFSPAQIRFLAEQLGWPLASAVLAEPPTPTRKRRRLTAMRDDMESRAYRSLKKLDDPDDPNSLGARVNLAQFLFDRMMRLDDKLDALPDSDVLVYTSEDVKRDLEEFSSEPRTAIPRPGEPVHTGEDGEGAGATLAEAESVRLSGGNTDADTASGPPYSEGPGDTPGGAPP